MTINTVDDLNSATSTRLEAEFRALLTQFDLGALAPMVAELATSQASDAEFITALEGTTQYQQRFPAIFARRQAGLPPVTPAEILSFERQTSQLEKLYGLPNDFLANQAQDFITKDVSYNQLQAQVAFTKNTLENGDPQVLDELSRLYGLDVSSGNLLAYGLNPDRALPILTEQARVAEISAKANEGGGFTLTLAEAKRLEAQGLDPNAVRQTAGQLANAGDVVNGVGNFSGLDRDTQLKILSGDQKAIGQVKKLTEQLKSPFAGGGGFTTTNAGVAGAGASR